MMLTGKNIDIRIQHLVKNRTAHAIIIEWFVSQNGGFYNVRIQI